MGCFQLALDVLVEECLEVSLAVYLEAYPVVFPVACLEEFQVIFLEEFQVLAAFAEMYLEMCPAIFLEAIPMEYRVEHLGMFPPVFRRPHRPHRRPPIQHLHSVQNLQKPRLQLAAWLWMAMSKLLECLKLRSMSNTNLSRR